MFALKLCTVLYSWTCEIYVTPLYIMHTGLYAVQCSVQSGGCTELGKPKTLYKVQGTRWANVQMDKAQSVL